MSVTQPVTGNVATQWPKPRRVMVDGGYLIADFSGGFEYPLLAAAKKGRALRALLDARTNDEVGEFTKGWGLLYQRLEGGRSDRFPLDLFHIERRKFLAVIRLGTALRGSGTTVKRSLQELAAVKAELRMRIYGDHQTYSVRENLPEQDRALFDLGVPISQIVRARQQIRGISLHEHAAQALAAELHMPHFLRGVRQNREWTLEETPAVFTLEMVLRWSCRSQYRRFYHLFCASCGEAAVAQRSDARFCSERCGTRARVRRIRIVRANR